MLGLTFSFKLDLSPYIVSKKTGALIRLWSVFFLRLLFISMNRLYTHVWNTVVTSGLVPKLLLGIARQAAKANMQVCWSFTSCFSWTLGLSSKSGQLTCFLYSYYFDRCSSELAQLVPLLFLEVGLLIILIDCMIFLSPFLDVRRMSMSTVSFLAPLDSGILCL